MIDLTVSNESWPLAEVFTISRGSKTAAEVVVVELRDGSHTGRGECVPYARYGETVEGVMAALKEMRSQLSGDVTRQQIQSLLKPGAARNALDCAFWDLDAKRTGKPVWELAGLPKPGPLVTAFTLSLDTPEKMAAAASRNASRPLMKLKLTGEGDLERVAAVREAAPNTDLIVDANEGWSVEMVEPFSTDLAKHGVKMIEQPLPASDDRMLADVSHPVPLCADESAHTSAELDALIGRYDVINIKLDKTGGLTEALALRKAAEAAGLQIMIGCMVGTSLAMAPAVLVGQGAAFVDLDGPLLLAKDRDDGLEFSGSTLQPPKPALWG
ncbi:MAG: dipeptide epimerase [Alphaproteobacteria bacterium]